MHLSGCFFLNNITEVLTSSQNVDFFAYVIFLVNSSKKIRTGRGKWNGAILERQNKTIKSACARTNVTIVRTYCSCDNNVILCTDFYDLRKA